MLARQNRLRQNKDFSWVFKVGRRIKGEVLDLKIINNSFGINRFGFIIAKDLFKTAVLRNKLKRRLREIMKKKLKNKEVGKSQDIVVIAKKGMQEKSFSELEKAVDKLLSIKWENWENKTKTDF